MKHYILIFTFLLASTYSFALTSKVITKENLSEIKQELEKEVKSSTSPDQAYLLYTAAANEFMSYRFYKEAQTYYIKATQLTSTRDKSANYINLMAVTLMLDEKKSLEQYYNETIAYFAKNPTFKTESASNYLNSITLLLNPEANVKVDETMYATFVSEEKIKSFISLKKYQMAFDLFQDTRIKELKNGKLQVTYDLLNSVLNKPTELLCEKEYNEFPNAVTFVSIYCKLLKEKRKEIIIPNSERKKIINYLEKESGENLYLYQIYKEIK